MVRENPFKNLYTECDACNSNKEKLDACREKALPSHLDIELTNACNLQCYMCPTGTNSSVRKKGFMAEETVAAVTEELKRNPEIKGVRLIRWGEPAFHPDFINILKKFKDTGKLVHFNTNGVLLTPQMMDEIVDMEIDSVKFSFQGVDEASYLEMRRGSDWNTLIENIKYMHEKRGGAQKPYIQISTTVTNEPEDAIAGFKHEMEGYCDYLNVGYTILDHLDVDRMQVSEKRKQEFLALKERENTGYKRYPVCVEAYDKLSIDWNGDVTMCCNDYNGELVIGTIKTHSLRELYHNPKAEKIRKDIADGKYGNYEVCSACFEYIK